MIYLSFVGNQKQVYFSKLFGIVLVRLLCAVIFQIYSGELDEAVKLTFNKTFDAACWSWFMDLFFD